MLNRFFIPQWSKELGKNLYIDFDLSAYTELTDDLDSLYDRANSSQFISINEKRELTGFDRIENQMLDEILIPAGVIPSGEFINNDIENTEDDVMFGYAGTGSIRVAQNYTAEGGSPNLHLIHSSGSSLAITGLATQTRGILVMHVDIATNVASIASVS